MLDPILWQLLTVFFLSFSWAFTFFLGSLMAGDAAVMASVFSGLLGAVTWLIQGCIRLINPALSPLLRQVVAQPLVWLGIGALSPVVGYQMIQDEGPLFSVPFAFAFGCVAFFCASVHNATSMPKAQNAVEAFGHWSVIALVGGLIAYTLGVAVHPRERNIALGLGGYLVMGLGLFGGGIGLVLTLLLANPVVQRFLRFILNPANWGQFFFFGLYLLLGTATSVIPLWVGIIGAAICVLVGPMLKVISLFQGLFQLLNFKLEQEHLINTLKSMYGHLVSQNIIAEQDLARPEQFEERVLAIDAITLGERSTDFGTLPVLLPHSLRFSHMHIVGKTGSGKTTLLKQLMRQDMVMGFWPNQYGFSWMTPKRSDAEWIFSSITQRTKRDERTGIVYFNPAEKNPVPFNPFYRHAYERIDIKAVETLRAFKLANPAIAEIYTGRMDRILYNFIYGLVELGDATFSDMYALTERSARADVVRERILKKTENDDISAFFAEGGEYDRFKKQTGAQDPMSPVRNLIDPLVRSALTKQMLDLPSCLDIKQCLDERMVMVFNLSEEAIGTEAANLLGRLIIAKFRLAMVARESERPEARVPHFLYIDEFHRFAAGSKEDMMVLLTMARDYRIGLIVAHQNPDVLRNIDSGLEIALQEVATFVSFQLEAAASRVARRFVQKTYVGEEEVKDLHKRALEGNVAAERRLRALGEEQGIDVTLDLLPVYVALSRRLPLMFEKTISPEEIMLLNMHESIAKVGTSVAKMKTFFPDYPPQHDGAEEVKQLAQEQHGHEPVQKSTKETVKPPRPPIPRAPI